MALAQTYTLNNKRLKNLFDQIKEAQAPEKFTVQVLKDWGFASSNDRSFIPLLKALGFLTADGVPTRRYHDFRGSPEPAKLMGQALREAYGDLFTIKERPTKSDRPLIKGKFKSVFNANDLLAERLTDTFFALLDMADLTQGEAPPSLQEPPSAGIQDRRENMKPVTSSVGPSLHYNIQIHLPPTKDIEVYAAIFKALREHLISE